MFEIFKSSSRILSGDKVVKSRLLNRLGIQVWRTVIARLLKRMRSAQADPNVIGYVNQLREDGLVVIEDFLPVDVFKKVQEECIGAFREKKVPSVINDHGATKVEVAKLNNCDPGQFESTLEFYQNPLIASIFEAVENKKFSSESSHWGLEHVVQGPENEEDRESSLHSDIFHSTHKAWLYLTDVEAKDGPLVYVRKSNRLGFMQLKEIYKHSNNPEQPSRRIRREEMTQMGYEEEVMVSSKNTLVIGDVCGYHRRLKGASGGERYALHISVRRNPFLPKR